MDTYLVYLNVTKEYSIYKMCEILHIYMYYTTDFSKADKINYNKTCLIFFLLQCVIDIFKCQKYKLTIQLGI